MLINFLRKIKYDMIFFKKSLMLKINKKTMLKRLHDFLNINNIGYWLEYGTLLGAIRQGSILSHDYDLDIGINQKEWNLNLRNKIIEQGFILTREISVDGIIIEESYSFKGISVDLFFCSIKNDIISTPVFRPFQGLTWKDSILKKSGVELYLFNNKYNGFETIQFENELWHIPKNYKAHLISYYGEDYIIPNKKWKGENSAIPTGCIGKEIKH